MKHIQLKETKVRVDTFDWQTSPTGRRFKTIGLSRNGQMPDKWCGTKKRYLSHWYYRFKYDTGEYFTIEVDYNDKFVQLIKNA